MNDIVDELIWLGVNTMDNHTDEVCQRAWEEIKRLRAAGDALVTAIGNQRMTSFIDALPVVDAMIKWGEVRNLTDKKGKP